MAFDYSAGRPSGNAVRSAGGVLVVRYAGIGSSGKRLTKAEYQSHAASGVEVRLVAESLTTDADSGYSAGVANCKKLEADRVAFGMPASTIMYAANDKSSYNAADVDYVRGFRDVVGAARTGVYGFGSYLAAVHADGYATHYWQAGPAPSRTGTAAFVGLWQRQGGTVNAAVDGPTSPTTMTVAGVACDVNNILLKESSDNVTTLDDTYQPVDPATGKAIGLPVSYAYMISQMYQADFYGGASTGFVGLFGQLALLSSAVADLKTAVASMQSAQQGQIDPGPYTLVKEQS